MQQQPLKNRRLPACPPACTQASCSQQSWLAAAAGRRCGSSRASSLLTAALAVLTHLPPLHCAALPCLPCSEHEARVAAAAAEMQGAALREAELQQQLAAAQKSLGQERKRRETAEQRARRAAEEREDAASASNSAAPSHARPRAGWLPRRDQDS